MYKMPNVLRFAGYIYVVTEDNFLYFGIKEMLCGYEIKKTHPLEVNQILKNDFDYIDIFIFDMSRYSCGFSSLLAMDTFSERVILFKQRGHGLGSNLVRYRKRKDGCNAVVDNIIGRLIDGFESRIEFIEKHRDLTEKERLILSCIMNGVKISTISQMLCISEKTVYFHRKNAFHKLGGRNMFNIWPLK